MCSSMSAPTLSLETLFPSLAGSAVDKAVSFSLPARAALCCFLPGRSYCSCCRVILLFLSLAQEVAVAPFAGRELQATALLLDTESPQQDPYSCGNHVSHGDPHYCSTVKIYIPLSAGGKGGAEKEYESSALQPD